MPTLIHQRVREAQRGENAKVIRRLRSGWAVIGDTQFLRGYCLLLPDPVVPTLNDLDRGGRTLFLDDLAVLGDAIQQTTGALRMNYMILGNLEPALHAHAHPRFADEPEPYRYHSPFSYPEDQRDVPFDPQRDRPLMDAIGAALDGLGVAQTG